MDVLWKYPLVKKKQLIRLIHAAMDHIMTVTAIVAQVNVTSADQNVLFVKSLDFMKRASLYIANFMFQVAIGHPKTREANNHSLELTLSIPLVSLNN